MISSFESELFASGFVTGLTKYSDHYPQFEHQNNIVIRIVPANKEHIGTEAVIDTAGQCTLDPALAKLWGLTEDQGAKSALRIRGRKYDGFLVRKEIVIEALSGRSINVDTTFFVPILDEDENWDKPNFIGLDGFLNRIRSAIDPSEKIFFFAKL